MLHTFVFSWNVLGIFPDLLEVLQEVLYGLGVT